jgi:Fe-S cluster biosynthesis and repair protein YggX
MSRMVKCVKLGEELPGLPYKPFNDALGQRIYDNISAKAWQEWIEHSKRIVNEYRLDLTSKKAHEVLKEQCEEFRFGAGNVQAQPDSVPEKKYTATLFVVTGAAVTIDCHDRQSP